MLIKIERTYGGQEGNRVRAGTVFWAGRQEDGPPGIEVITNGRGHQLLGVGLATRLDDPATTAAPGARPLAPASGPSRRTAEAPQRRTKPAAKPQKSDVPAVRVRRPPVRQVQAEPAAPERIAVTSETVPSGSRRGRAASRSSSPAAPAAEGSTSEPQKKLRGRRSGGSPSITHGASPPSQTSTTPATPDGGNNTAGKSQPEGEVLD